MPNVGTSPLRIHLLGLSEDLPLLPMVEAIRASQGLVPRTPPNPHIYRRLIDELRTSVMLVDSAREAHILLHPHDALAHPENAAASVTAAQDLALPLVLLSESDHVGPSSVQHGTLYRSSICASRQTSNERVAAGFVPDLLNERDGRHPRALPWRDLPSVGFIGHATHGIRSLGYLRRGWQHFYGFRLRERVLRAFEASPAVDARFVRRTMNLGPPMAGVDVNEHRRRMRREYVDSVLSCDYALCMRGAGNWSYRLFETLSAGRIPVLVDTDTLLPLEGEIDWTQHLCRIPASRLHDAGRLLAEFHADIGAAGFERMQLANRKLWQERLEPAAFFGKLLRDNALRGDG